MPVTIPSGRRRPPVAPAVSTTGSTGSTHGETAVAAPASKANRASSAIHRTVSYLPGFVSPLGQRARTRQLRELVACMHRLDAELLAEQQRALADLQHQLVAPREVLDHVHELLEEGRGSFGGDDEPDPLRCAGLFGRAPRTLDFLVV